VPGPSTRKEEKQTENEAAASFRFYNLSTSHVPCEDCILCCSEQRCGHILWNTQAKKFIDHCHQCSDEHSSHRSHFQGAFWWSNPDNSSDQLGLIVTFLTTHEIADCVDSY